MPYGTPRHAWRTKKKLARKRALITEFHMMGLRKFNIVKFGSLLQVISCHGFLLSVNGQFLALRRLEWVAFLYAMIVRSK